jgi:hypothetical protein
MIEEGAPLKEKGGLTSSFEIATILREVADALILGL